LGCGPGLDFFLTGLDAVHHEVLHETVIDFGENARGRRAGFRGTVLHNPGENAVSFEIGKTGFADEMDESEMESGGDLFADLLGIFEPIQGIDALEIVEPVLRESGGNQTNEMADEFRIGAAADDLDGLERGGVVSHQFDDFGHDGRVSALHHDFFTGGTDGIRSGTEEILDRAMIERGENHQRLKQNREIIGICGGDGLFEIIQQLIADVDRIADGLGGVMIEIQEIAEIVGEMADQFHDLGTIGNIGAFEILDEG